LSAFSSRSGISLEARGRTQQRHTHSAGAFLWQGQRETGTDARHAKNKSRTPPASPRVQLVRARCVHTRAGGAWRGRKARGASQ
jgi:hypothetical protein